MSLTVSSHILLTLVSQNNASIAIHKYINCYMLMCQPEQQKALLKKRPITVWLAHEYQRLTSAEVSLYVISK